MALRADQREAMEALSRFYQRPASELVSEAIDRYIDPVTRFWSKVRKSPGCWEWVRGYTQGGYGAFWFHDRQVAAHRFSYVMAFGPIPEGMFVCHHCDNRICVRPDHLFLGSIRDNNEDRDSKGRMVDGSHHPNARLTPAQVAEIRQLYSPYGRNGGLSQQALADKYGVAQTTIGFVVRGLRYKREGEPLTQSRF